MRFAQLDNCPRTTTGHVRDWNGQTGVSLETLSCPVVHHGGSEETHVDLGSYRALACAVIGRAIKDARQPGTNADEARHFLDGQDGNLAFWTQWLSR